MESLREFLKQNRGMASRLARHLGVNPSTITQWKSIPVEHLAEVEQFTGISRETLLPEAFRNAKKRVSA